MKIGLFNHPNDDSQLVAHLMIHNHLNIIPIHSMSYYENIKAAFSSCHWITYMNSICSYVILAVEDSLVEYHTEDIQRRDRGQITFRRNRALIKIEVFERCLCNINIGPPDARMVKNILYTLKNEVVFKKHELLYHCKP